MKKFKNILFLFLLIASSIYSQEGIDIWTTTTTTIGRIYAMVIDELNPSTMYACGLDQGVWKTTNSGANWNQINTGLLNTQVQAMALCKNSSQVLYAGVAPGANDGVYKSTDGGSSWTRVINGIAEPVGTFGVQALMVHPSNPNIAWCTIFSGVTGQDAVNGIYKTIDGGANWFSIINGIGTIKNFLSMAMSPVDPNTIYLGSSFLTSPSNTGPSVIYKSTDGGANWVLSSTGLPNATTDINPIRTMQVSAANPNVVIATLFMNAATGGFYLSTNAGASWTKKHNGLPADIGQNMRASAIRPLFDNQFFIGMDGADSLGVWATTNGGNNWFDFNGGTMLNTYVIRALVFNPTGNHTLFAGRASATANLGGVYEYTFSVVPVEFVSFTASAYGNEVNLSWITATETNNFGFEVERTDAGNSLWNKVGFVFGNGSSTEMNYYSFTDQSVPVGQYLYRLKQIDLDGSFEYSDQVEVNILPADNFALMQNYPNPFNPSTKISFIISQSGFTSVKVYDVLGNEAATIIDKELTAGSYDIEFNASGLTSGVYYYTLKSGSFVQTKKMLLLK